jgi:Tfp pilus assembly protein PilF
LSKGLPDPKNKLWEFNSILQAQDAFRAGEFDAGKELLDKVAQSDPQMYVVPFLAGEAALRQEKWGDAAAQLRHSLNLNPNFDEAMTALSHVLHGQGNDSEARMWLDKAVTSNPENYRAWYELGTILAHSDPPAALEAYRKAVSIQPSFARGQRDLGVLEVGRRQYASASEHLERALRLGLDDPHLRNFLGIADTQTNRMEEAVKNLREAIKQDPSLAEAHLNLGFAYHKLHQQKAAKAEYEAACRLQSKFCGSAPAAD